HLGTHLSAKLSFAKRGASPTHGRVALRLRKGRKGPRGEARSPLPHAPPRAARAPRGSSPPLPPHLSSRTPPCVNVRNGAECHAVSGRRRSSTAVASGWGQRAFRISK